jgi:hypothetical protein
VVALKWGYRVGELFMVHVADCPQEAAAKAFIQNKTLLPQDDGVIWYQILKVYDTLPSPQSSTTNWPPS